MPFCPPHPHLFGPLSSLSIYVCLWIRCILNVMTTMNYHWLQTLCPKLIGLAFHKDEKWVCGLWDQDNEEYYQTGYEDNSENQAVVESPLEFLLGFSCGSFAEELVWVHWMHCLRSINMKIRKWWPHLTSSPPSCLKREKMRWEMDWGGSEEKACTNGSGVNFLHFC